MTKLQLKEKLNDYMEYKRMLNELKDCINSIEEDIKDFMGSDEEVNINGIKISNKKYTQNRFDSSKFKKEHQDIYDSYLKQISCTRFSIKF